jgi:hypothetical protein
MKKLKTRTKLIIGGILLISIAVFLAVDARNHFLCLERKPILMMIEHFLRGIK